MQQTKTYQERSWAFLAKAREELAVGDLEQASEKGWGAAAMMVKAVAGQREMIHEKHFHLFDFVHGLARQTGDPQLRWLFHVANGLHGNFYEDRFDAQTVSDGIDDVEQFIGKVELYL
jgi:hypothetical protein